MLEPEASSIMLEPEASHSKSQPEASGSMPLARGSSRVENIPNISSNTNNKIQQPQRNTNSKPNRFISPRPRRRLDFDRRNVKEDKRACRKPNKHNLNIADNTRKGKNQKFRYGNYNRYYGYRNATSSSSVPNSGDVVNKPDSRLAMMSKELFECKTVLDIGCNTGQVTLAIAKDFAPRKITGIDIDPELIAIAKRNLCQGTHEQIMEDNEFPKILPFLFGKILSLPRNRRVPGKYPDNITFAQANYILDDDEKLKHQSSLYDCILCLSITKWIHLNWGDSGLKQMFHRIYLNLLPGGYLILEPQAFSTYYKKAKLVPELLENFQSIRFKPEHFREFLLKEVGFASCQSLGTPSHQSKGFQRPLYLYTKST